MAVRHVTLHGASFDREACLSWTMRTPEMSPSPDQSAERSSSRRALRRPLALAVLLCAAAAVAVAVLSITGGSAPHGSGAAIWARVEPAALARRALPVPGDARVVRVTVQARPSGPAVGARFLGLSFETDDIPWIAHHGLAGDLAAAMRSLGRGGVLRFGGVSTDLISAWSPSGVAPASWAHIRITRRDLAALAALARATGWRVILSVDLGHFDARGAAAEAAAARSLLGQSLAAIEIGNEPDKYVGKGLRAGGWNLQEYLAQARAYRRAIAAAAPGVPIAGPDPSSGTAPLAWLRAAAGLGGEAPALLTDHFYPTSSCGFKPTVGELMSAGTRAIGRRMVAQLAAIQRSTGRPVLLDETNDISCRGEPGVSDSFASALWAVDFIARGMASGLAGMYFHDLPSEPHAYSPLAALSRSQLAGGRLHANPEWYALLLAGQLRGSRPVRANAGGAQGLGAWAFVDASKRLRLALVDFDPPGSKPLLVRIAGQAALSRGSALRLLAPSAAALNGVSLGKAQVVAGRFSATPRAEPVRVRGALATVVLPPSSAALVTLTPVRRRR